MMIRHSNMQLYFDRIIVFDNTVKESSFFDSFDLVFSISIIIMCFTSRILALSKIGLTLGQYTLYVKGINTFGMHSTMNYWFFNRRLFAMALFSKIKPIRWTTRPQFLMPVNL